MGRIAKIVRIIHYSEDFILFCALLGVLCLAVTQIVMRNFFDTGFLWAESFVRILVLWIAMIGALVATRKNNHIRIDAMSRFLPTAVERSVAVFTHLASSLICFIVAFYGLEFVSYEFQDNTIAFANVPTWMCQVILPIGFGLMGVRFFFHAIRGFAG